MVIHHFFILKSIDASEATTSSRCRAAASAAAGLGVMYQDRMKEWADLREMKNYHEVFENEKRKPKLPVVAIKLMLKKKVRV